jgi:hypothetical protein
LFGAVLGIATPDRSGSEKTDGVLFAPGADASFRHCGFAGASDR